MDEPAFLLSLRLAALTALLLKVQSLSRRANGGIAIPTERLRTDVEALQRQTRRLSELVNDLLDVSRIGSGRFTLELDEVDLCELVREVTARFDAEAARAGTSLELHVDCEAAVGQWDRMRLEQVISNLLSNALKYGPGTPIHIGVQREGRLARLVVRDEGIGIAPEALHRIFEKFERGVSDRHYGGLGLGLYVTRQIVEALGGTVRAASELGQGATFTVELPLSPG
ncbi:MAG: sensor histidine kinase [Myxococcales bacterium]